ncbi:MAG: glycerophosphodiester phosphodiesterase family protein [Bacteroidota bacterium]
MKRLLVFICLSSLFYACNQNSNQDDGMKEETSKIDWQGHRGARGLLPENSIPAFLKALEYPEIVTLEMDAAITKDKRVVLSHEPWMSPEICFKPNGDTITKEERIKIMDLTYEELKQFDCGSKGHHNFEEQVKQTVYKPSLEEVVTAVYVYCRENNRPLPNYNIEIKSSPRWDSIYTPLPEEFAKYLLDEIKSLEITSYVCVQSFDFRALQAVHEQMPEITTALLIGNIKSVNDNIDSLGFVPTIYSPHYKLINTESVQQMKELGMKVIPWTVNDTEVMNDLLEIGVDGIITDYPNRIPKSY